MNWTADTLINLLPAVYRIRDDASGGLLHDFLDILAREAQNVQDDIAGLYENWFIETCGEWVVPYLGDLLGVRGLHTVDGQSFSGRARVANTLLYRQRKGTASMLEQLARDTTGWPARVVEFFELLETTQYLNHTRLANFRTPDLRNVDQLELLDTPFDTIAHSPDVRHITSNRGRHNIPNIGIFLWRLQSYAVPRSRARIAANPADGRYYFDPLGTDAALFNSPQTETDPLQFAAEINVPGLLRRRLLYEELEARRQALIDGTAIQAVYFGANPVLKVWIDGTPVLPEEIAICDLDTPATPIPDGWPRPPATKSYVLTGSGTSFTRNIKIGVDPKLGRLALPEGVAPASVEVGYAYGFSGDLGAGPYNRRDTLETWIQGSGRAVSWQMGVTKNADLLAHAPNPGQLKQTIADAIAEWNTYSAAHPNAFGLITILDSDNYVEDLALTLETGSTLALIAADWPLIDDPGGSGGQVRVTGDFTPSGLRPHIQGNLTVQGAAGSPQPELILDGLLVEGSLTVLPGDLGTLRIGHTTLAPPTASAPQRGSLIVQDSATPAVRNSVLSVTLLRSITGKIQLPDSVPELQITDSITADLLADGATANIQTSTVLGATHVRALQAGNSVFTGVITAIRRQVGCIRYCHIPQGSTTPRRFRCQPDLALSAVSDPSQNSGVILRVFPSFTSEVYGQPAFAQLSTGCAPEINAGAEDGSEMGAFNYLKQPQRSTNLESSLAEYMRFGLEAGIFFVS